MAGGRVLELQLHLLDRQVVDRDGRPVCKVDDLELAIDPAGRPYVSAILVGPRALGPRLGGRLGRWVAAVAGRLAGSDAGAAGGPQRIDFALVTGIGSAVTVARRRDELPVAPFELWVEEHIIGRIPGSRHEGE